MKHNPLSDDALPGASYVSDCADAWSDSGGTLKQNAKCNTAAGVDSKTKKAIEKSFKTLNQDEK